MSRIWTRSDEKPPEPSIAENREQRRLAVVRDFERRRSAAQLQAAVEHADQGDLTGAQQLLANLIAREPDNVDARLRLAEVHWAAGSLSDAETQLRQALAAAPQRADVQHALGSLLDALGRTNEGVAHLEQACVLEPSNAIYRLAVDSLAPATSANVASLPGDAGPPSEGIAPASFETTPSQPAARVELRSAAEEVTNPFCR